MIRDTLHFIRDKIQPKQGGLYLCMCVQHPYNNRRQILLNYSNVELSSRKIHQRYRDIKYTGRFHKILLDCPSVSQICVSFEFYLGPPCNPTWPGRRNSRLIINGADIIMRRRRRRVDIPSVGLFPRLSRLRSSFPISEVYGNGGQLKHYQQQQQQPRGGPRKLYFIIIIFSSPLCVFLETARGERNSGELQEEALLLVYNRLRQRYRSPGSAASRAYWFYIFFFLSTFFLAAIHRRTCSFWLLFGESKLMRPPLH